MSASVPATTAEADRVSATRWSRRWSSSAFINGDELVELTSQSIRIRKKFLKEHERKRSGNDG
jgi:predicted membrane GTPase involved in stress response